jgi:hypothetical protein
MWFLVLTCCLLNVFQAGLEPMAGSTTAFLFSQCNVLWRSFPQSRGSGCWSFDSPCCFISPKCYSSISARCWSHGAHTVCFCTLVTILDLKQVMVFLSQSVNLCLLIDVF